ncbi:MAG: response regulator [Pseudobutyrivibrio sp.]|mgnify:FL=1|nr:response regulator [Pseudobutyrivibrio sp.]
MYKLLIADDEPIERMVVKRLIDKWFSDRLICVEAVNGREAVEKFSQEKCQIALLDIEMPGVNGLEAATKIRKISNDGIIIFLTAFDEFDYARKALYVKALDYLLKPTDENELVNTLEEAISLLDAKISMEAGDVTDRPETENMSDEQVRLNAIASTIREFIDEHYVEDIALQDVATRLNYSDAYFCKIFKQCFDKGFVLYLSEYRMAKAKELLADISINIKEISTMVGYRDANYFAKVFKRNVGETPSEYRTRVLKNK